MSVHQIFHKILICHIVQYNTVELQMLSAFSTTMFAFAGATSFPTIQSDMRDRRQFFTAVLIAMAGNQGGTKRLRLSWLTNSALVYEPKCGGGGRCGAGSQPMRTVYTGAKINFGDLISC
jgi:hypothetical protein